MQIGGFGEARWRNDSQLLLLSAGANLLPSQAYVIFNVTLHYIAELFCRVVNIVQFLQVCFRITNSRDIFPGTIKCICSFLLLSRILIISYDSDASVGLSRIVFTVELIWLRLVGGTVGVILWRRDLTCGGRFEFSYMMIVRCLRRCMERLTSQADKGSGFCVTLFIRIFQVWRDEKFLRELELAFLSTEGINKSCLNSCCGWLGRPHSLGRAHQAGSVNHVVVIVFTITLFAILKDVNLAEEAHQRSN